MQPDAQKNPGRRLSLRQTPGLPLRQTVGRKSACRLPCQSLKRICRPRENRNGNRAEEGLPGLPCRHLTEIVGADQPDEGDVGVSAFQCPNGVHGISGVETPLDIAHPDAGVARRFSRGCHPLRQGRHALGGLQRVLRRDQPPDLVQPEALQGEQAYMPMAFMGRVEGAAQQADPAARGQSRLLRCASGSEARDGEERCIRRVKGCQKGRGSAVNTSTVQAGRIFAKPRRAAVLPNVREHVGPPIR